jgi:large subunit ribosomal protein L23
MINSKYFDIIRKPLVTEKTTNLSELNKYVFVVDVCAGKEIIKKAIENIFKVKVLKVNVINKDGKIKKFKGRLGKQKAIKKAIVTLEKGQTIDFTSEV